MERAQGFFIYFFLLSILLRVTLLEARENSSSQQEDSRICLTLRESLCFRLRAYAPLAAAIVHRAGSAGVMRHTVYEQLRSRRVRVGFSSSAPATEARGCCVKLAQRCAT